MAPVAMPPIDTPRLAVLLALLLAAPGAARACEEARGSDGKFAVAARAAAEALASETCAEPLFARHASARFWRPEAGVFHREEVWAFGPEDAQGNCYVDAAANAAGAPDQIVLRCVAVYRCPDGAPAAAGPAECAPME